MPNVWHLQPLFPLRGIHMSPNMRHRLAEGVLAEPDRCLAR
jgi:hypothetical protein